MDQNEKGLPPIIRELSKDKHNKLARRLYKNNSMNKLNSTAQFSYLRNINPDSSILAGSTLSKTSSSKNLLIPSVSLKRNKQFDMSQRSMQFTQGKILLSSPKNQQPTFLHYKGDLKHHLQKTSAAKTLFKKISNNRYDSINEKKIIPDQLLGCSSDQQQSKLERFEGSPKSSNSRGMKLLKGFKNQSSSINEDQETLTPNDFIQLIQQDGSITNQFCYLKKMSHPYDLKIIEFQDNQSNSLSGQTKTIKPSMLSSTEEYITISSRGVSYFSQQNSRFVPLERWKKQAYFFSKLMKLQFFSKYRLFKNFAKWKKHIRKTAMKSTTDKLRNELMIGDKFLRKALLSVKDSCFVMQSDTNYCKFDDCEDVMEFSAFKSCQQQFIQNEFEKRIVEIEEDIKNNLISNMSDSMREFKEENKISTSNEGKGIPLLIGDEKNLDMPYTKEATLRIQQEKFKKFLKLVEFMIVDSKIKMMNESTEKTVKKMEEENENYEKQVIQSKYKFPFKGKQYIKCSVKINVDQQIIQLKPTREDLNYMFEQIVNRAIVKLCRNHKRIINDDEILEIIYDSNQKIVKQPQTNILKVIIMTDDRQEKIVNALNQAMNQTYSYLQIYSNRFSSLVLMYFNNLGKLNSISSYEAKDHEVIMQSLQNWKNQLTQISMLSQQHESSIFLLDFQEFKNNAIRCVSECLEKMKKVMPEIFISTTQNLLNQLELCQQKMRIKPVEIEDFIEFQKSKNEITNKMEDYADKLAEINCIWIIMKSYSSSSEITNISRQQRQINRLQTKLNNLRTKLEQAEMNTKSYETNAQELLKSRIPLIKEEIYKLYMKIKSSKFDVNSSSKEVGHAIEEYQQTHDYILQSIKQLKEFQQQLSMEEYNEQTMTKFSSYFTNYKKIWKLHQNMQSYKDEILSQPWTFVNIEDAKKEVESFFNEALKLKKLITSQSADDEEFKVQLNDIDVLSYVFLEAKNMKPLMETVQCLRDKSLGEKEWKQIKSHFEKINKEQVCAIIDTENKEATISSIQEFKISEELDFIQNVVFRSKKQLEIHNKMIMVNKFWVESSNDNAGKNLADNFQKYYWDIITKIDQKITVINGISEDSEVQAQQLKQNISINKTMFDTLRVLLTEWQIHQRYLHYFEPIFMNTYWKSNTRELKIYNQAQGNWKKLLKQSKDYSLKRWAGNQKAITTIRQNIVLFEQLKKAVEDFLTVKRDIFPKFYFLSNEELLHVLLSEKQIRSIEEHINKVFTCIKSLEAKELSQINVSTDSQNLSIKFSKAFNSIEVEEIFKTLQESIKASVKTNLRNCLTNFQKDDFNKKKWIKDHLLQSLLFVQKSEYTKIIEFDYMGQDPQDLSQYLIYQNTQVKELQSYLKDHCDEVGLHVGKIETLIVQQILHRQVTQMLLNNHIVDQQSYEWQKQIRCYFSNYTADNATTKFFTNELQYGYEFVNLQGAYPYMMLSQRQTIDLTMALKLKYSPIIKGRQSLVLNFSKFNGKYYRSILCDKKLSEKYLINVCFGAYLEGCFVQFEEAQNLLATQMSVIANVLKEIYSSINRKDKSFNFGWKKNPINPNAGIVFKLSDTQNISQFTKNLSFPNKAFQFKSLPYSLYVNLMIEVRRKNNPNIGSKLMKFIDLIHEVEGYQIFHFKHIRKILHQQKAKDIQNDEVYFVKEILDLITQTLVSAKKISFYKTILIEIFFDDKNAHTFFNESANQNSKLTKEKSDFKFIVNSLVEITDKKSICIIAGPTQSGKVSVISQAYKQKISRNFEIQIMSLDILTQESLFGCYVNGLWRQGILIKKIKQLPVSKQQWIVFEGQYCQKIIDIMYRLNHNYLQLSNGQLVFLSSHWKFIFSLYNLDQNCSSLPKNICLIQSSKFINIEDSMYLMMEKRIKPHFEKDSDNKNLQNYNQLSNMCTNRIDKLVDLKTIGFKNDYLKPQNTLRYLINILDALLTRVPFEIKLNKEFSKSIEKIYLWSIFWSIGSGIPTASANKYEKSLFDSIKGDIQRSQNLSLLRLEFDTPVGSLKKFKNNEIKRIDNQLYLQTLDLKSKAYFVELMIKGNFPVILIGKSGSGKSKFMQYIQSCMNPDEFAFLPIKLRKDMTHEQFRDIMFKKTRISIKHTKKKCFCSSTNKRLVILIDDFNLLDSDSQIGEMLTTCIKNGYYYDHMTNQKIYIDNISFVVAENETYEFRIDNRFLKYFKPIYINEIELKDISQAYKQDVLHVEYARDVFDTCVSLHNFVCNLQSNGQIKREFPISQHTAVRIMQCLKEYAEKLEDSQDKSKRQSLPKVWAYVSKMQYTGYSISSQIQEKIDKQIKNHLNLIIQNSNQKPKPVPYLSDLLDQLVNRNHLVKADGQYEQYYEYLSFLISLSQSHNLLTIGQPLPESIKTQILEYAADVHSLKYHHVKNTQTLQTMELKNSLVYVSTQNFDELVKIIGFVSNNTEYKLGRYIVDCQNHTQFHRLIKHVPFISSTFHVYTKKISLSKILISQQYNEWLYKLQTFLQTKLTQREELNIISNLLEKQKIMKGQISKRKKTAGNFLQRYNKLTKDIEVNIKSVEELTLSIKQLKEQQETTLNHRKQLNETLTALRSTKLQDQEQQERITKIKTIQQQINTTEHDVKTIKDKKKKFSVDIADLEITNNILNQISKKLTRLHEQFAQESQQISSIEEFQSNIIFCLTLYYFGVKQNNQTYLKFVEVQQQNKTFDLVHSLKIIFGLNPSEITREIVVWIFQDKSIIVKDKNNRFLRTMKKSVPRLRIVNDLNSLHNNHYKEPIIYTGKFDPSIFKFKNLTCILREDLLLQTSFEFKTRSHLVLNDSPQNQRQSIKLSLYAQKQKQLSYQIFNYKQEIYQLHLQILEDEDKLLNTFLNPDQKDIKKIKSLLYTQWERLRGLQESLKNVEKGLETKYGAIIDACCLFKKCLTCIEADVKYFEFSDKKFQDLILRSIELRSSGIKTRKNLLDPNALSKKSFNQIRSKKQIVTERMISRKVIQPTESPNLQLEAQSSLDQKRSSGNLKEDIIPENQQNVIQAFKKLTINDILAKLMLALKSKDSLFAYGLMACFVAQIQYELESVHRQALTKIMKKQIIETQDLLQLQIRLQAKISQISIQSENSSNQIHILKSLRAAYQSYKDDPNSTTQKVINFGDIVLNKSFQDLLQNRYDFELLNGRQNFLIISNQNENAFEILEKYILSNIQDSNWCYMFENQFNSEKITQIAQKCSINWFIIINNKNPLLFQQLKDTQKQRNLNYVFLYSTEQHFLECKSKLPHSKNSYLLDLTRFYAEDSIFVYKKISQIYLNNFAKLSQEKPEIQQLSRVVFYDQATEFLKNISKNILEKPFNTIILPISQQFFLTKVLNQIVTNLKGVDFNQFTKILLHVCYQNQKQKQCIILKQAKKMINKKQDLLSTFVEFFTKDYLNDDFAFQGSAFVGQSNKILIQNFSLSTPQEIVNNLVPQSFRKKYPLDCIYFRQTDPCQQKQIIGQKEESRDFNQQKIMSEIDKLLNDYPTFSALQSQSNKKEKHFYKEILKDQIRIKLNTLKKVEQNLKKYKKLLQIPKIFSEQTQTELLHLTNTLINPSQNFSNLSIQSSSSIKSIQSFLNTEQKSVEYLQKFYLSKQNQKLLDPSQFKQPAQFIKYYLYESSHHANFRSGQIQARFLTEKDKEAHFDTSAECKSLTIGEVWVRNGKFDQNKNVLESSDQAEMPGKISSVHLCFSDKEISQLTCSVPVYFGNTVLFSLMIINKAKDESVWKDKIRLQILKNSE